MKSIQTSFNFNGLQFLSQQVKLTKQEKKLYSLIPIGKENAVQGSYLAETLNIDKRTVIDKVNKLRLNLLESAALLQRDITALKINKSI